MTAETLDIKSPPEYCLELAQSHEGSLGYVYSMLEALSIRSIRIVKFQLHLPEYESTHAERFRIPLSGQDTSRFEYWKRTGFTYEQWRQIKNKCDELDIEFLCTPLSPEAVDFLEDLDVRRYKIASGDLNNLQLIERVVSTKKEIILSTGMSSYFEIEKAVESIPTKNLTLLQCTSKYPTSLDKVGLNVMQQFRRLFPEIRIGFSDHTGNPLTAMLAFALGADFVEQHVVFSREQYGPDSKSSIELGEVNLVQNFLSVFAQISSSPVNKDSEASEMQDIRNLFGRGLSPKRNLAAGEVITEDVLTMKKPKGPLGWDDRYFLVGKKLNKNLPATSHITFDDIQVGD